MVLLGATVEGAVRSAPLLWRGTLSETLMNRGLLPSFHGHTIATLKMWFIYCNVISETKNMLAAQRLSFDNCLMSESPIIAHMPANTMMAALTGVNQSRRPTFFLIFSARVIRVHFRLV